MQNLIGIPYKFHGRDKDGVDCLGIVMLWYKQFLGIEIPEYFYCHKDANDPCTETIASGETDGHWQSVDKMTMGDVIIFRIRGKATHIGVYLGGNDFLHSIAGKNSCIERVDAWQNRIVKAYRWKAI